MKIEFYNTVLAHEGVLATEAAGISQDYGYISR